MSWVLWVFAQNPYIYSRLLFHIHHQWCYCSWVLIHRPVVYFPFVSAFSMWTQSCWSSSWNSFLKEWEVCAPHLLGNVILMVRGRFKCVFLTVCFSCIHFVAVRHFQSGPKSVCLPVAVVDIRVEATFLSRSATRFHPSVNCLCQIWNVRNRAGQHKDIMLLSGYETIFHLKYIVISRYGINGVFSWL